MEENKKSYEFNKEEFNKEEFNIDDIDDFLSEDKEVDLGEIDSFLEDKKEVDLDAIDNFLESTTKNDFIMELEYTDTFNQFLNLKDSEFTQSIKYLNNVYRYLFVDRKKDVSDISVSNLISKLRTKGDNDNLLNYLATDYQISSRHKSIANYVKDTAESQEIDEEDLLGLIDRKLKESYDINTRLASYKNYRSILKEIFRLYKRSKEEEDKYYENMELRKLRPVLNRKNEIEKEREDIKELEKNINYSEIAIAIESHINRKSEILVCECGNTKDCRSAYYKIGNHGKTVILKLPLNRCDSCGKIILLPIDIMKSLDKLRQEYSRSQTIVLDTLTDFIPYSEMEMTMPDFYKDLEIEDKKQDKIEYDKDLELKDLELNLEQFALNEDFELYEYDLPGISEDRLKDLELVTKEYKLSKDKEFEEAVGSEEYSAKVKNTYEELLMGILLEMYSSASNSPLYIFLLSEIKSSSQFNSKKTKAKNKGYGDWLQEIKRLSFYYASNTVIDEEKYLSTYDIASSLIAENGEGIKVNEAIEMIVYAEMCKNLVHNPKILVDEMNLSIRESVKDRVLNEEGDIEVFERELLLASLEEEFESKPEKERDEIIINYKINSIASSIDKEKIISNKLNIHSLLRIKKFVESVRSTDIKLSILKNYRIEDINYELKKLVGSYDLKEHDDLVVIDTKVLEDRIKEIMVENKKLLSSLIEKGSFNGITENVYSYTDYSKDNNNNSLIELLRRNGDFISSDLRVYFGNSDLARNVEEDEDLDQALHLQTFEYVYSNYTEV